MNIFKFFVVVFFTFFVLHHSFGQKKEKINLEEADILEGGIFEGKKINKFKGNVRFRQQETLLYCDLAYQYPGTNAIEAFSNVRIVQGDSLTLSGDRLSYNGDTKKAF